jgi:hypothetical protein
MGAGIGKTRRAAFLGHRMRSNKHGITTGDIFRIISKGEPELLLVEKANEFVGAGASGAVGYKGTVVKRVEPWPSVDGEPSSPLYISLEYVTGRKAMNERIDMGEAVRIAHLENAEEAQREITAWAREEDNAFEAVLPPVNPAKLTF